MSPIPTSLFSVLICSSTLSDVCHILLDLVWLSINCLFFRIYGATSKDRSNEKITIFALLQLIYFMVLRADCFVFLAISPSARDVGFVPLALKTRLFIYNPSRTTRTTQEEFGTLNRLRQQHSKLQTSRKSIFQRNIIYHRKETPISYLKLVWD